MAQSHRFLQKEPFAKGMKQEVGSMKTAPKYFHRILYLIHRTSHFHLPLSNFPLLPCFAHRRRHRFFFFVILLWVYQSGRKSQY